MLRKAGGISTGSALPGYKYSATNKQMAGITSGHFVNTSPQKSLQTAIPIPMRIFTTENAHTIKKPTLSRLTTLSNGISLILIQGQLLYFCGLLVN